MSGISGKVMKWNGDLYVCVVLGKRGDWDGLWGRGWGYCWFSEWLDDCENENWRYGHEIRDDVYH